MPSLALARFGVSPQTALTGVGVAAVAVVLAWIATGSQTPLADLGSGKPAVAPLQGRAEAVAGDLLRVGGTTVRLAGIEAPESQQACGTPNRRSRCAAAARTALARLVEGRAVSCTASGADSTGRPLATCKRGNLDINAELVRQGHVFAESGLFASYTGLEREARAAKAGVWATGEAERPAEFRAKAVGGGQAPRARRLPHQGPHHRRRARVRAALVARLRARPHPEGQGRALVLLGAGSGGRRLEARRAQLILC